MKRKESYMTYSKKLVLAAPAAIAFGALLAVPLALAHAEVGLETDVSVTAGVGSANANAHANATSSAKMNSGSTTTKWESAGGSTTGVEARTANQSDVAAQVQALLSAADRDGGIGADVRTIAHEYASSSARIEAAHDSVENRPAWLTFLIGTDYGSLGQLRSELVMTQNQIDRLKNASDRTADASVKADLDAQIDVLEAQASTTADFIAENESHFSLFGWLARIFE